MPRFPLVALGFAAALAATPALACRGTAEYPQAQARLEVAQIDPAKKLDLMRRLEEGRKLHEAGHAAGDTGQMKQSLKVPTA
ncbi:MAG: hypothetical protein RQ752_13225 [Thermohalobaculum sp.]|nr:hypothetical protein [Thermohalobaculum sp.]